MKTPSKRLKQLIDNGYLFISKVSEAELSKKQYSEKWSKKEILGHLVDSAIHNLQRFTEIQFKEQPYKLRKYNQNALVKANDYQHCDIKTIANLWLAINTHIINIIEQQTQTTLNYKIELETDNSCDLKFLIIDYIDHLEHHLNQIKA
ncbi:DinB family protein [Flavobacteriaceae bacterium MHTCC 0001]